MKATLSVSMIVRDESAHLGAALENLREFADEVVVLDTGSTDDTKRLAEAAGAVVRDFQWCDDFAKARNASLSLCTQQFVMWLDADDRIPVEDARRLRRLLEESIEWDVLHLPYLYGGRWQGSVKAGRGNGRRRGRRQANCGQGNLGASAAG